MVAPRSKKVAPPALAVAAAIAKIPPWATLLHPQSRSTQSNKGDGAIETAKEGHQQHACQEVEEQDDAKLDDAQLRSRAYHAHAARFEACLVAALEETTQGTVWTALDELMLLQSPNVENGTTTTSIHRPAAALLEPKDTDAPSQKKQKLTLNDIHDEYAPNDPATLGKDDANNTTTDTTATTSYFTIRPMATATTLSRGTFDPLLLPLLIVKGPFWPRDRTASMAFMHQSIGQKRPRSCVVWLQRPWDAASTTPTEQQQSQNGSWRQKELLRRCLLAPEEPNAAIRKRRSQRHRRHPRPYHQGDPHGSSTTTVTDPLVHWAANTRAFDDIVLLIENDRGETTDDDIMDFIQWAADRRANHGLPLVLVVWEAVAPLHRSLPLRSNAQSSIGLLVRHVDWPKSESILTEFWSKLLCHNDPNNKNNNNASSNLDHHDVMFPREFMAEIRRTFAYQNDSVIYVLSRLRHCVALQFSMPGSFLSATKLLSPHHSKRITSLLYSVHFHNLVSSFHGEPKRTSLKSWMVQLESQRQIAQIAMSLKSHLVPLDHFLLVPLHHSYMKQSTATLLNDESRKVLLSSLARFRKNVQQRSSRKSIFAHLDLLSGDRAPYEASIRVQTMTHINNLIVLIGQCVTVSDALACVDFLVEESIAHSCSPFINSGGTVPLLPRLMQACRTPEPRRDQVGALLHPIENDKLHGETDNNDVNIPGKMYKILFDCAAISEAEWFNAFLEITPYSIDAAADERYKIEQYESFLCGLKYLQIAGLIRGRRTSTSKGGIMYDKTAHVWCGGD